MEWAILAAFIALAALLIALPSRRVSVSAGTAAMSDLDELLAERESLLAALREVDDDTETGRITPEARQAERQALGPALRAVTEALAQHGVRAPRSPERPE